MLVISRRRGELTEWAGDYPLEDEGQQQRERAEAEQP